MTSLLYLSPSNSQISWYFTSKRTWWGKWNTWGNRFEHRRFIEAYAAQQQPKVATCTYTPDGCSFLSETVHLFLFYSTISIRIVHSPTSCTLNCTYNRMIYWEVSLLFTLQLSASCDETIRWKLTDFDNSTEFAAQVESNVLSWVLQI